MRSLIVGEFISLDGVVEAPETWHFPYVDAEMMAAIGALAASADTMLLGRTTYESFAGAFQHLPAGDPVGDMMNAPTKVVVSRTRPDLTWKNSVLLDAGDAMERIAALKAGSGGTIITTGSTSLVQAMLRADLVDGLDLLIHPIVVGKGERLFTPDIPRTEWNLGSATTLASGVAHHAYHRSR